MRDHIFISYRRDDARGASGRLYDWLRIGFGRERVFRDVHSIGVGKWRDKVDAALARSAVCVAVIGPRWALPEHLSRLHDAGDLVRHELATALASDGITLVPALVEGAKLPPVAELPKELKSLFEVWNAREITEAGWEEDTRRLIAEIADAAQLPVGPDLQTLLHDVAAAGGRIAQLESERDLQAEQIERLHGTVADLTRKLADAGGGRERRDLGAALAALAGGDTLAAEDAFEREFEARARAAEQARRETADAARNVAHLAMLRDIAKAVAFYRKALDVEPEHAETARMLAQALVALGDLRAAGDSFTHSMALAGKRSDTWAEMAAQLGLGDVATRLGRLPDAEKAYTTALRLAEALVARDPANSRWQRDLSVSHERIGNVRVAQGDGPGALIAYRSGLVIREALAARDPANTECQRDLSVSYNKLGNVLATQGDGPAALAAYRKGLAIAEALAASDPANPQPQRDLAVSYSKIGNVTAVQGDGPAALAAYRKGLAIVEALVGRDPANTEWQRDLSVSHNKIGDLLVAQGDGPGALAAYRAGLAIADALVARDPANAEWQRDCSVIHNKIGDALVAQGDSPAALAAYRKDLAISEALTARDPANAEWQRDHSVSYNKIGDMLATQGAWPEALAAYRKGLAIAAALVARDSANTEWQRDLSVSYNKVGDVLTAQGDAQAALAAYREGLSIREALAARDPANSRWQLDLAVSCAKLGTSDPTQSADERRAFLIRAREILLTLKAAGRLMPSQDWIGWLEDQLRELDRK